MPYCQPCSFDYTPVVTSGTSMLQKEIRRLSQDVLFVVSCGLLLIQKVSEINDLGIFWGRNFLVDLF